MAHSDHDAGASKPISRPQPRTYARRGTASGAICGLLFVVLIFAKNIDPKATEHKGIFPAAVVILCGFSVMVVLVCTLVGRALGSRMLQPDEGEADVHDAAP